MNLRSTMLVGPIVAASSMLAGTAHGQLGSPPVPTPKNYCVTAIHLAGDSANNVNYRYDRTQVTSDNVIIGYPVGYWDVRSGKDSDGNERKGYFNLSVLLDKVESGNCLANIALRSATRGAAAAPPPASPGQSPYKLVGYTFVDATFTPSQPYTTDNTSVAFFSQPVRPDSKRAVTGVTLEYSNWCRGQPNSPALNPGETCLGSWKGEGGKDWFSLYVTTSPYTPPAAAKLSSITGSWFQVLQCTGCSSTQYQTQVGVTDGKSSSRETESSKSLSVSIGATLAAGTGGIATQSVSVGVTGTVSETQRSAIETSFSLATQTQNTFTCDKGSLWQWKTVIGFTDGSESAANSAIYVCTGAANKPSNIKDISWGGT